MSEISSIQRRALRAAAHHLDPVVSISSKGLSPTVLTEIDRCLKAHELIKVRLYDIEREERDALCKEICATLECVEVQQIGKLLVLWREKPADAKESAPARRRAPQPKTKKQAAAALERKRRA